jgi:ribosomal protein L7/L12
MPQKGRREMLQKTSNGRTRNKRQKFVELAERRTVNAIKAIRVIAKLGNKSAYEYDDADVKKIANALTREVEALKARMTSSSGKESVDFKL